MKKAPRPRLMMRYLKRFTPSGYRAGFSQYSSSPFAKNTLRSDDVKTGAGQFYREKLRAFYSDVLWSLKTCEGDGYIYVVIEHQSTPDAHMAFRLMRYATAAMQRHLDAGHKTLPLVIPMLFYHGAKSPYPFSLCWLDEFDDPALARQLYATAFPLVDITVVPDNEIMQHRRIAMLELVQKHIRQRDLMGLVERLAVLLITGNANDSQLKRCLIIC